jgi:putative colanic acid biosynthesis acetyltransferase WcaF
MSQPQQYPSDAIEIRNDHFDGRSLDRGRSKLVEMLWHLTKGIFFLSPWPWPSRLKRWILIKFGAKIGHGLYIRPRVNIHFPWKLRIGNHCWIGDSCEILNLEPITMEDHVALAHEVYLAAAGHNIRSRSMAYQNKPITIKRGSWIATRAYIGPGVTIGTNCVVAAGAIVVKDVPDHIIVGGNPAKPIGQREITEL